MDELILIGIGTGNPDHVTFQAVAAMNRADLILIPRKGEDKADLADLRRLILSRHLTGPARVVEFDLPRRDATGDYLQGVGDWHDAIAAAWRAAGNAGRVALLIWGDPSLYDSSLRIAGRLAPPRVTVIPGITAIQALCAAHAIPLNEIGKPFTVTTGRRLRDHGWPADTDTLVVMLDGGCAFAGLPGDIRIWWGAYLGMAQETLIAGPLGEVADRIEATRAELRAQHGWIMDLYLLRRE